MFFPVPIDPWAGVVAFIKRVCPQLAIPPCLSSSFLEQGKSDQGGRSSLVLGMEESQKFCVNQERRRRKECSFHGCIKGSARVPGSLRAKFRMKNVVRRSSVRGGPLTPQGGTAHWGVMFVGFPCCCRDAPWNILVLTDAPCCELSHQKIKSWVWVNTGIILEQISVI